MTTDHLSDGAYHVRAATPADAEHLAVLRYRFRSEFSAPIESETEFVARATHWFADRLTDERWRGWVAVGDDGLIVGHVFVQLIEKIPNPVPEPETLAYLTNLHVIAALRNRGIGTLLLEAGIRDCEALGAATIVLWATDESVRLYHRHGFATPVTILEHPLASRSH